MAALPVALLLSTLKVWGYHLPQCGFDLSHRSFGSDELLPIRHFYAPIHLLAPFAHHI